MSEKIKLLQAVVGMHNDGSVKLSYQEINQLERETKELIRRSQMNRNASKNGAIEDMEDEKHEEHEKEETDEDEKKEHK